MRRAYAARASAAPESNPPSAHTGVRAITFNTAS
ncbi:MAG: hypothetical protein HW418_1187, partial [Anaerolineales bacterium]|nr:hypothetical protein [Anaerolineales bacterium]